MVKTECAILFMRLKERTVRFKFSQHYMLEPLHRLKLQNEETDDPRKVRKKPENGIKRREEEKPGNGRSSGACSAATPHEIIWIKD